MTTYAFTAAVKNLDLDDTEQVDRLFTEQFVVIPSEIDGLTSLEVEIEADSGERALKTFYDHLASNLPEVTLTRIDDDLVTTSEIATRLGVNRETVRSWVKGIRLSCDFPVHRMVVGGQKVWAWATVHAWACAMNKIDMDDVNPLDADAVEWVNGMLAGKKVPSLLLVYSGTEIFEAIAYARGGWSQRGRFSLAGASPRYPEMEARDGSRWSHSRSTIEMVGVGR